MCGVCACVVYVPIIVLAATQSSNHSMYLIAPGAQVISSVQRREGTHRRSPWLSSKTTRGVCLPQQEEVVVLTVVQVAQVSVDNVRSAEGIT